jgi:hypothetical protein
MVKNIIQSSYAFSLVAVLAFAATGASTSNAESDKQQKVKSNEILPFPAVPPLASYETLMSVSPTVRQRYVQQLRILLVDLSEISQKNRLSDFVYQDPAKTELQEILDWVFPRAKAAQPLPPRRSVELGFAAPVSRSLCPSGKLPIPTEDRTVVLCDSGYFQYSPDNNIVSSAITEPQKGRFPFKQGDYELKAPEHMRKLAEQDKNLKDALRPKCKEPNAYDQDGEKAPATSEDKVCDKARVGNRENLDSTKLAGQPCIFAGNVSRYVAKPGSRNEVTCEPPTAICESGQLPTKAKDKCPNNGRLLNCEHMPRNEGPWVVCSPISFGLSEKDLPFCAQIGGGRGKNATRSCAHASDGGSVRFDGSKPVYKPGSTNTKDYLSFGDAESKKAAWERFKEGFQKLCKNETSPEFARNCEACKVMHRRLIAMNARIKHFKVTRQDSSPSTPPTCAWNPNELDGSSGDDLYRASGVIQGAKQGASVK